MKVVTIIVEGPVTRQTEATVLGTHEPALEHMRMGGRIGAMLRFEGVVRRVELDQEHANSPRDLAALDYQTYDPMAQRELDDLARTVAERHTLTALIALHSRGRVAIGEISFVLMAWSAHRAAALGAMVEFIDRLKRDVPIWKRPIWAE